MASMFHDAAAVVVQLPSQVRAGRVDSGSWSRLSPTTSWIPTPATRPTAARLAPGVIAVAAAGSSEPLQLADAGQRADSTDLPSHHGRLRVAKSVGASPAGAMIVRPSATRVTRVGVLY
jgi:hypothetical protein